MASKIRWIILLFLIFNLFLTGCAIKQKIKYSIDDIQPQPNAFLSTKKLNIDLFEDIRNQLPENKILFEQSRETKIDGERVCINSEKNYATETIPQQIADMIAKHFNQRGTFGAVLVNENADYNLTGKIKRFYAEHKFSTAKAIGASFGLIGALATLGVETPAEVEIVITDIKLYGKDGELIKTLNDVEERFNGNQKPDAYCWSPYFLVDLKFRNVVENIANQVDRAVIEYGQ
ncbi:MAG: hypothetical protein AABZ36_03360 [Nitrospirota bacterium]